MLINILLPTLAFLLSWLLTAWLARRLPEYGLIDVPNKRSSHAVQTPRGGGLAILLTLSVGFTAIWTLGIHLFNYSFYVALLIIAGISFIDDKFNLSSSFRFLIQFLTAAFVLFNQGWLNTLPLPEPLNLQLAWLKYPFSFVWILGVMNIFNFLDGIDGYAGVQTILMGAGLFLFYEGIESQLTGLLIIGAAGGFLVHNWPPAKIFMGDIGSVTMGFCFAVLPFYLHEKSIDENVLITTLLLWFFLADGAFTIFRRSLRFERIWAAHRSHLYQRLNIAGWTHQRIVVFVLSLQLVLFCFTSMWNNIKINPWVVIIVALLLFSVMVMLTIRLEKNVHNRR